MINLEWRFKELIDTHQNNPAGPDIEHALTGINVRKLLNCAVSLSDFYLELGVYTGGTFCAAMHNNIVQAVAIDSWAEKFGITGRFGTHPRDLFKANTDKHVQTPFTLIESDHWAVKSLPMEPDLYFYDGDHSQLAQEKALTHYAPMCADEFIFIVDDYNWERVRLGTALGILRAGLEVVNFEHLGEDRNDDATGYWNGVGVFLLSKIK